MLADLKVSSWACKCVFYDQNKVQKGKMQVFNCRNEIYQWIELKE